MISVRLKSEIKHYCVYVQYDVMQKNKIMHLIFKKILCFFILKRTEVSPITHIFRYFI